MFLLIFILIAVLSTSTDSTETDLELPECSICTSPQSADFASNLNPNEIRTDFSNEYSSFTLPCGHTFHIACIIPWLAHNPTCPNCRELIPHEKRFVRNSFTTVLSNIFFLAKFFCANTPLPRNLCFTCLYLFPNRIYFRVIFHMWYIF